MKPDLQDADINLPGHGYVSHVRAVWGPATGSHEPTIQSALGELQVVGVVVPGHDEQDRIEACLDSIAEAAAALPSHIRVHVAVVLDACSDRSPHLVDRTAATWRSLPGSARLLTVTTNEANVGAARAAGCQAILSSTSDLSADRVWLASTDADSVVPSRWLTHQATVHAAGNVAWVGTVEVTDHNPHLSPGHLDRYRSLYATWDGPDHPHVHATNLGVRADAYQRVGGFRSLATGEDHDLVRRLAAASLPIARGLEVPVLTSARLWGRAPDGFAEFLRGVYPAPL